MAQSCGAGELANELLPLLNGGKDFSLPDIDFDKPEYAIPDMTDNPLFNDVTSVTLADLTIKKRDGTGAFDVIMAAMAEQLKFEYEKSRITGNDYTRAYIELTSVALGNATQFLLQKDQSYWTAITAQMQAQRAQVEVVQARVQLATLQAQYRIAQLQAMTAEVEYGLTKLKLATEDATYCNLRAQTAQTKYTTEEILPVQKDAAKEQMESVRAQTLDTRTDGAVIKGAIGKQKELHSQQIISFQRDSEVKAARLFTEAWITQKTIDEGLLPPAGFANPSVETVLAKVKQNNGFV